MLLAATSCLMLAASRGAVCEELPDEIDRAIAKIKARQLHSLKNTPWVVMHAMIAFETDLEVVDVEQQKRIGVVDYLCQHAKHEGSRIFRDQRGEPALPTRGLSFGLRESFKVQDHVDQFLMTFADADVPLEQVIVAEGGRRFTVGDMLKASKSNLRDDQELGWTLVVVAKYLPLDTRWKSSAGKTYHLERLVQLALQRDPNRETEGGPHHLYGIAYALQRYRSAHDDPLQGVWREADQYLKKYIQLARRYQQTDGSFSAAMFRGSRAARSPRQMVWATGHTIEWFSMAMTADELRQPWVQRGVTTLVKTLQEQPLESLSDGGLYHAAHALRLYRNKVFAAEN